MRLVPPRPVWVLLGPLLAIAGSAGPLLDAGILEAQAVRVAVVSELEGLPVRGAVLTVLDGDRTVGEGLTTIMGTRRFDLPGAGTYRVRVRRVGFAPFVSAAVTVGADETREVRLVVPSRRVELPPVVVESPGKACAQGDTRTVAAAALWEQVSAALAASEISRADSLVETRAHRFRRRLDREGNVIEAVANTLGDGGARPFVAVDPGRLARRGYIVVDDTGSFVFYAPDARVMLSPEFEAGHCFTAVAGAGDRTGLVGLAFQPVRGRRLPDVRGTLWLDPASAELTLLEFEYVNARWPQPARRAGGHVAFARLPSGAWMVRDWVIRMPRFNQPLPGRVRRVLLGYTEEGGIADCGLRIAEATTQSIADSGLRIAEATTLTINATADAPSRTANCGSSVAVRPP
jgi:hypothetical protein